MSIARRGIGRVRSHARKLPFWIKSPLKRFLSITSQTTRHQNSISGSYDSWVKEFDTLSVSDRDKIRSHIRHLKYRPLISVIMPVYETAEWALREAIDSIRDQLYTNWELCLADDPSSAPHINRLLRQMAAKDSRIKWIRRNKNGNISAASNSAFSLAVGEFVALMDHDDLLAQHALYEVAVALNEDPTFDIIYSDEDQIDAQGRRSLPYFKTDWNIDLLLGHNMISHLGVSRRALLERVGGFREGFEGSQDYDVALRCADATILGRICHIPSVLYHWRRNYGATSFSEGKMTGCSDAALRAITDHLDRLNEAGKVEPHPILPQCSRVIRAVPHPSPLVSLIVPTRDRSALPAMCVNGLLNKTDYRELEVLIVDNASELPETLELFERLKLDPRVRILSHTGPFNYSAMNNLAVAQATGSIVGLINNDIDVINSDWLSEMGSLTFMNDKGAVGTKLNHTDEPMPHGGSV